MIVLNTLMTYEKAKQMMVKCVKLVQCIESLSILNFQSVLLISS